MDAAVTYHDFIAQFNAINIHAPWMIPYTQIHQKLTKDIQSQQFTPNTPLYIWLNQYIQDKQIPIQNYKNNALTFTHQNQLPHGIMYESFIDSYKQIPTRDNLHDWFGACVWLVFYQSKSVLNQYHIRNIADNTSQNKRNRIRDAITVWDENGIILAVCDDDIGHTIIQYLQEFSWQNALYQSRDFWYTPHNQNSKIQAFVFGHALLEQLIVPRKNLCGHAFVIKVNKEFFQKTHNQQYRDLDTIVSKNLSIWLQNQNTTPKDLQPLPVLGIPYFWENQTIDFYADTSVFRTKRRSTI